LLFPAVSILVVVVAYTSFDSWSFISLAMTSRVFVFMQAAILVFLCCIDDRDGQTVEQARVCHRVWIGLDVSTSFQSCLDFVGIEQATMKF